MAAAVTFPRASLYGCEIQTKHFLEARRNLPLATLREANFFELDLERHFPLQGKPLILANPPWVMADEIARGSFQNRPALYQATTAPPGLERILGSANFDIAEAVFFRCYAAYQHLEPVFAFLLKQTTARRILRYLWRHQLPGSRFQAIPINAKSIFKAQVEACVLMFEAVGHEHYAEAAGKKVAMVHGQMVEDYEAFLQYHHLLGPKRTLWRSGVKHDAKTVFVPSALPNIEEDRVFPHLSGRQLFHGLAPSSIILSQLRLGEPPTTLKSLPKTWDYFMEHLAVLQKRKSRVFRGSHPFPIFGVGDYTFKPWKVAVASLYSKFRPKLVGPVDGKPVIFDDTIYFVAFDEEGEAKRFLSQAQRPEVAALLASLVPCGSKRSFTAQVLNRVQLEALGEAERSLGG